MGFDPNVLKNFGKKVKTQAGSGKGLTLYSSKIEGSQRVRLLPPLHKNMKGLPAFEVEQAKFPFIGGNLNSLRTWGLNCPMMDLIDEYQEEDGYKELFKYGSGFFTSNRYEFPILPVNPEGTFDATNPARILNCPPTMALAIHDIISDPEYIDIITSRVDGVFLTLKREGKGINTEYKVTPGRKQTEMPSEHYTLKAIPDIVGRQAKFTKHPDYLEAVAKHYLFDEYTEEELEELAELEYDVLKESGYAESESDGQDDEQPVEKLKPAKPRKKAPAKDVPEVEEEDGAEADGIASTTGDDLDGLTV